MHIEITRGHVEHYIKTVFAHGKLGEQRLDYRFEPHNLPEEVIDRVRADLVKLAKILENLITEEGVENFDIIVEQFALKRNDCVPFFSVPDGLLNNYGVVHIERYIAGFLEDVSQWIIAMKENLPAVTLSDYLDDYIKTALWSTTGFGEEEDQDFNMDSKYSIDDLNEQFLEKCKQELDDFFKKAKNHFTPYELENPDHIAHDFWLTRNRHGAGFWDGDYKNGDVITQIAQEFGESDDDLREAVVEDDKEDIA